MISDDGLNNVSGGAPNPAWTKKEFLTPHCPDGARYWFEHDSEGAVLCSREEAVDFAKKYNCNENEILEIWERFHEEYHEE